MCGIAGIIALQGRLSAGEAALAREMTAALAHRGPDGQNVLSCEQAAFGGARLRVTDLTDAASLPMASAGGRVWLSYNGAVTNFRELAAEYGLAQKRPLNTGSDAEVVLRLYEELGEGFLSRLSGHFAFCLYDRGRGKALLVRDPYGLRPVFYLRHAGRLYFASEIKGLLEVQGWDRRLDCEALWHFFTLAYLPGGGTPFAEVHELRGGHLLEIDLPTGTVKEREYSRINYRPDPGMTEESAASGMRGLLLDSVRRNLATDATAGMTLSGGVDTSGMLGLARELGLSRKMHTFSISMQESSFDESRYQRLMSDYAGTVHHEVRVGPEEVLGALFSTAAHLDEPTGDGAAVPSFLLAAEARKHVSVLLSGEGGDEVFNAYETHRAYRARNLYRKFLPAPARAALRGLAAALPVSCSKLSFDFVAKRFTEGVELGVPESHIFWRHTLTEQQKESLITFPAPGKSTAGLFRELYDSLPYPDGLDRISHLDMWYYFIDDLMVKNDRSIMAHSVETRFPYMDRAVVELASRIPGRLRLKGFSGRNIQKLALRGLVPPEILRRSNMGLELPHSLWFFGGFSGLAEKYFSRERVERSGVLRWEAVEVLWKEHLARRRDNGRALWCILSFLIWFDLFVYDGNYKDFLVRPVTGAAV